MITPDVSAVKWRKASRSGHEGGNCVEVGAVPSVPAEVWRKASRSGHEGGECVEVVGFAQVVAVRDSKDPDGPKLAFTAADWHAFTGRIKGDVHNLP
ncbi:DUF397 domain-containing protein [Actinomadura sp. BRA 177]|uniref:DUF397 domain-containing protein n=1 Tax=Actinomadura sp. BRA 177 TaxID=2745202 RepID=UPI001594F4C7|nr:DUF397 domain-containing protein [Actinomadura sp. BRA 177]NVI88514.1 DUF397 domain-containing protein [Actinomadura sp. BRA 177]